MKKVISAILSLTMLTCLPVTAADELQFAFDQIPYNYVDHYDTEEYAVETDTFSYKPTRHYGMQVEPRLTEATYMVVWVEETKNETTYVLNAFHAPDYTGCYGGGRRFTNRIPGMTEEPRPGDLISGYTLAPCDLSRTMSFVEDVVYYGNAIDVYGEAFQPVLDHEMTAGKELLEAYKAYDRQNPGVPVRLGDIPFTDDTDPVNFNLTYANDKFTVEAPAFRYSTGRFGIQLETEDELEANYMVSGVARNEAGKAGMIYLTPINQEYGARGFAYFHSTEEWEDAQLGDLLYFEGVITELETPEYVLYGDYIDGCKTELRYLGNGADIYGDEFVKVIRHELINKLWWEPSSISPKFDVVLGDPTEDDEVTIMDVVCVNRNLMIGAPLNCYAQLAADVDKNGTIDETDSLNILKNVVGILPDFAEFQNE